MSPENFERLLHAEAAEAGAAYYAHDGDHVESFAAALRPVLRRLVDAQERGSLAAGPHPDPTAELGAAWETFREAVNPPEHLPIRRHFSAIVAPLLRRAHEAEARAATVPAALLALAPYVHGDPRVDRWQIAGGGEHPPTGAAPAGFEPLAAWTVLAPAPVGFTWERPLRACEAPPATTEETSLAALLVAWDSWPDVRGDRYASLLEDLGAILEIHKLADNGGKLTETARAIVAQAAGRGQP